MPDTQAARAVLRSSRPVALFAAVLLTLATLMLTAGPAAAHDIVSSSDPADGATVPAPPTQVSVTFDQTPQPGLSTLTVVGPDGTRHEAGPATAAGNVLTVPVGPLPVAGVYEIGYRIVSSDGHPTSGSLSFTLTTPSPAGTASPAGSATPTDTAAGSAHGDHQPAPPSPAAGADQDTGSGGVPTWVFVVIALVVIAGAVALVLRRRV